MTFRRIARGPLFAAALLFGFVGAAEALTYDFDRPVAGGGGFGGTDPQKRKIVQARGQYLCMDVGEGGGNQVRFTIWSEIPEPNARVAVISFDLGRHVSLFSGLKVVAQSPGVKSKVVSPTQAKASNGKSVGSSARYRVELPYEYSYNDGTKSKASTRKGGLGPGNFIVISASLGPGQTLASVVGALNEGASRSTESSGFRVWMSGHSFLGGPPPGVATISDDATFMVRGVSQRCRRR